MAVRVVNEHRRDRKNDATSREQPLRLSRVIVVDLLQWIGVNISFYRLACNLFTMK